MQYRDILTCSLLALSACSDGRVEEILADPMVDSSLQDFERKCLQVIDNGNSNTIVGTALQGGLALSFYDEDSRCECDEETQYDEDSDAIKAMHCSLVQNPADHSEIFKKVSGAGVRQMGRSSNKQVFIDLNEDQCAVEMSENMHDENHPSTSRKVVRELCRAFRGKVHGAFLRVFEAAHKRYSALREEPSSTANYSRASRFSAAEIHTGQTVDWLKANPNL